MIFLRMKSCLPGRVCCRIAATSRKSASSSTRLSTQPTPSGRWPAKRRAGTSSSAARTTDRAPEHAALAPRYLGLRLVIAKGFARIHRKNLINYGILSLVFDGLSAYEKLENGVVILISDLRRHIVEKEKVEVQAPQKDLTFTASQNLMPHMRKVLLSGGLTNWLKNN